jgi:uncharacterized RDD family membrane protein YckC
MRRSAPVARNPSTSIPKGGIVNEQQTTNTPSDSGNVYAAPAARVDDVVPEGEQELAERVTRLVAAIVDGLPFAGIGIVAAIMIPAMGKSDMAMTLTIGFAAIVVIGVLILNAIWFDRYGQTIGKRIMKIKTVRSDGSKCGLARAFFLRNMALALAGLIPIVGNLVGLVDALLIFREDRKCLHDNIADTIVIKA